MSIPPPAPSLPIPIPSPTILTHLTALSHPRTSLPLPLSLPHLHPHAPLSSRPAPSPSTLLPSQRGGGKGQGQGQVREKTEGGLVGELKEGVKFWRGVVEGQGQGQGQGEEEGRLYQALREVLTHQSTLLSTSSSLLPLPSLPPPNTLPTIPTPPNPNPNQPPSPSTLLQTLSSLAGLQTFLEDSQFGLQQASLAIAGERVVVDVDLGVDVAEGEGEGAEGADGEGEGEGEGGEGSRMGTPLVGTPLGTPLAASTPAPAPSVGVGVGAGMGEAGPTTAREERPKIKLLKLEASHVTPKGETAQSAHVKATLTMLVEEYLELYNSSFPVPQHDEGGNQAEAEEAMADIIRHLENELRSLKRIDDVACAEGEGEGVVDWFEEVEKVAGGVDALFGESLEHQVYPAERPCIFPSFRLLPPSPPLSFASTSTSTKEGRVEAFNPTWQIRPRLFHLNESVPSLPLPSSPSPASHSLHPSQHQDEHGEGEDVTMDTQEHEQEKEKEKEMEDGAGAGGWLGSDWVIECLDPSGLVCPRQWLSSESDSDQDIQPDRDRDGRDEPASASQVGSRIESLLYRPYQQPSFMPPQAQERAFPYGLPFVQSSRPAHQKQGEGEGEGEGLEQHWSIAHPGPGGWVVGRVGLGRDEEGLRRAIVALRRQTVMNQLFCQVFKTEYCRPYDVDVGSVPEPDGNGETDPLNGGGGMKREEEGEDAEMAEDEDDDGDDDWLSAPQNSIPCSLTILPSSYLIALPILDSEGKIRDTQVTVRPSPVAEGGGGYVRVGVKVDGEDVEVFGDGAGAGDGDGDGGRRDLVGIVDEVVRLVRG
ncbi:hypothetical protein B9479_003560 [Cryptococcus floricola]|uniref:Uncharacterized protein n=1 Tax=Cryptococcus floricola TaxID=2591691 RepID=A0A5D3AY43_9TREE|nr:hypothetical protein B9479_003560 [Cryptococcus floricola]